LPLLKNILLLLTEIISENFRSVQRNRRRNIILFNKSIFIRLYPLARQESHIYYSEKSSYAAKAHIY